MKDILTISGANEQNQIVITDMVGRQIFKGQSKKEIDVSALPAGMYLLTIAGEKSFKFVKQ